MSNPVANLIIDFYDEVIGAITARVADSAPVRRPAEFSPGFLLPEMDSDLREFFAVATAVWRPVTIYREHQITMLDLTGNPGTNTTKTFPSLLIVARAVEYIRRTGERIMIFSPTSANKGVALRDAVLRAITVGLVKPEQLRVVTLAPVSCRAKLRSSALSTEAELRELNPMLLYMGEEPETVKAIGRQFVTEYAQLLADGQDTNVWFSLDLGNYIVADTARAFFEHSVDPTEAWLRPRLHAHAVSSAFGLLGYHAGREILENSGRAAAVSRPASLLVQHLGTPDMVLNLRHGDFDLEKLPTYTLDPRTGMYIRVDADLRFPSITYDIHEVLDPTFYTRRPATSTAMNAIIARHGGDGIVVSLAECVNRYPILRSLLADGRVALPADFRMLREWSTVMAFTGVFNAIDRGLIKPGRDIVVHGTGHYSAADFEPLDMCAMTQVRNVPDIAAVLVR
jgi:hypothetical protein